MLTTLTTPDRGRARVAGHDVVTERSEVRRRISLTGQSVALDEPQTGRENLHMMARLRGLPTRLAHRRADELLTAFELVEVADARVATYSGGMRRRLDLAAALVVAAEVVFLDEPTTGLDPRSRRSLWDLVAGLAATGVTVFLTTQYLDEADRLADRLAIVDRGRVVAEGTTDELKARVAGQRLDLRVGDASLFADVVTFLGPRAAHVDPVARTVGVGFDGSIRDARVVLEGLDRFADAIAELGVQRATLDDVFLALTGQVSTRDEKATVDV